VAITEEVEKREIIKLSRRTGPWRQKKKEKNPASSKEKGGIGSSLIECPGRTLWLPRWEGKGVPSLKGGNLRGSGQTSAISPKKGR